MKILKSEKSQSVCLKMKKSQREMREFQKSKDMTTDEKVSGEVEKRECILFVEGIIYVIFTTYFFWSFFGCCVDIIIHKRSITLV